MEKLFCHLCDHDTDFQMVEEFFDYNVRGEEIRIKGKRAFCIKHSEEELFKKDWDMENQRKAFHLYREKHNFLSPEEIKEIREKYKLSQRDFSRLLGFGEITISRYERGSLPTNVQNQIIKESADPFKMKSLLEKNGEKINDLKRKKLEKGIEEKLYVNDCEQMIIREIKGLFNHTPDEYSGYKAFDFKKFSDMVWYFSKKSRPYLTKLNKLMFYADYYYYKQHHVSISGAKYIRDYYGPVPEKFQTLYDNIQEVELVENEHGSSVSSIYEIDEKDIFEEDELEVMEFVNEKFKDMYASEIKDFSHEEKCWIEIPNKCLISYNYANELDMHR